MVNWDNWARVDPTEQDKLNKEQHESDQDGSFIENSKENDNEFQEMEELELVEVLGILTRPEIPYICKEISSRNSVMWISFIDFYSEFLTPDSSPRLRLG